MAIPQVDLEVATATEYVKLFIWKTSDGNPVDLTSWQARMHIRKKVNANETFVELRDGTGITLGGTTGEIEIQMTAAQTKAILEDAVYDLHLIEPTGAIRAFVGGDVIITPPVTRGYVGAP